MGGIESGVGGEDEDVDEELRGKPVEGDAAAGLEVVALCFNDVLLECERVELCTELRFLSLEDVDLPRKDCDLAIDVLGSWAGHLSVG